MRGFLKVLALLLMSWGLPHYAQYRAVTLPEVPDSFVYHFPEAEVLRIPEFGFAPVGKVPMKQLGEEQQLPSLELYDVFMDSRRRLWIGLAFGGFLSYDGLYLRHYKDLGDFNSGAVTDFLEDREGRIWIASFNKGIAVFDGEKLTRLSEENGLPSNRILCLLEDRKGRIWAGTNGAGVICFEGQTMRVFTTDDGLPVNKVWRLEEDHLGRIWMGTVKSGLALWDDIGFQRFGLADGLPGLNVRSLKFAADSTLWIGTDEGLLWYREGHFEPVANQGTQVPNRAIDLAEDPGGRMWIADTDHGLWVYESGTYRFIGEDDGLPGLTLTSLHTDPTGGVWIATLGAGLVRYEGSVFENYPNLQVFGDQPRNMSLSRDSTVIICLDSGHLQTWKYNEPGPQYQEQPSPGTSILDAATSSDGKLWLAADNLGVCAWDGRELDFFDQSKGIIGRFISIISDSRDRIIAGSYSNGVAVISGDSVWQYSPKELEGKDIWTLFEDRAGRIWLGTDKAGLWLMNNDLSDAYRVAEKELGDANLIRSISEDKDGNVWLALKDRGIACIDAKAAERARNTGEISSEGLQTFTSEDGLISNLVDLVYCDRRGFLWLGTGKGIQRWRLGEAGELFADPKVYGLYEGLRSIQAGTLKVIEDPDGKLWWPGTKYLSVYNPREDREEYLPALPVIDFVKPAESESLRWQDTLSDPRIQTESSFLASLWRNYMHYAGVEPWHFMPRGLVLSHDINRISFGFHAINWKSEDKVRIQFMLHGLDEEWREAGDTREKEYNNLPPGDYSFRVRALNTSGKWSESAAFDFSIQKPFWATAGFIAFVVLVLALAIYAYFRYRIRALEKANVILEERVRLRTEDLNREKLKSDRLLLNILPERTADELKNLGYASTRNYSSSSVLFSDFKGFTFLSETISPKELITTLDEFFKAFDEEAPRYGIEKIKTIGDAYMCAAGIPEESEFHAARLVAFGLKMLSLTKAINTRREAGELPAWNLRIGIHSGPLIAGVVGRRKFAYDIWGDTVNTASRMESSGEVSRLNISEPTYELVKDIFVFEERGKIQAKNKGELAMYFVNGFAAKYAAPGSTEEPNETFMEIYCSQNQETAGITAMDSFSKRKVN